MAKKDEEDNRDIFEKALDYAPIVGGIAGAVAGRKSLRRVHRFEKGPRKGDVFLIDDTGKRTIGGLGVQMTGAAAGVAGGAAFADAARAHRRRERQNRK